MRVCTNKNEENEKLSTKGSSKKYDNFMRVCMNKNEEDEKTSTLGIIHKIRPVYESLYGEK